MAMTNEEMLDQVETAISTILKTGQSYRIGTRTLTRADLSALVAERDKLKATVDSGNNQLFDYTSVGIFSGR
jgi:hypothetical protein